MGESLKNDATKEFNFFSIRALSKRNDLRLSLEENCCADQEFCCLQNRNFPEDDGCLDEMENLGENPNKFLASFNSLDNRVSSVI